MASVDIAVPCYQYGRFLRDCLASVLSQDGVDVRVLIIDNASTDDSLEVARTLASEDSRVEVVAHRTNLGHHASFNEGIDWASSDCFMVLCADDLLAPGSLARAVLVMEQHRDVVLSCGRAHVLLPDGRLPLPDQGPLPQWEITPGRMLIERFCRTAKWNIYGCAVVVRTASQKRAGYYRLQLPHTDDVEMWMRVALLGEVAETSAVQGIWRFHGLNRHAFVQAEHMGDILNCEAALESFFANEGGLIPDGKRLCRTARRTLGKRAYWSALAHLIRGQPAAGLDLMRSALRLHPMTAVVPPVDYLFRRDDAFDRIADVVAGTIAGRTRGRVR